MGKKRKPKIKKQAQSPQQSNSFILENKFRQLRSEFAGLALSVNEPLAQIARDMMNLKKQVSVLSVALQEAKIITDKDLDKAVKKIKADTLKMFNNGLMRGNPKVTCYNCDFTIEVNSEKRGD